MMTRESRQMQEIAVFIAVLKWPQRWEGEKKDVFYVWSPTRSQQNKNSKFITYNLLKAKQYMLFLMPAWCQKRMSRAEEIVQLFFSRR